MDGKKTKKSDKSQKYFRSGTEERKIFSLTLSIIAELLKDKKIEFNVNSSGKPEFTLVPSKIRAYVKEKIKDQISFENFLTIISTEIESLMMASFFSDKTKGVQENIPQTIIKDVGIKEFLERLEETNKVLTIPEALKQEVIFKKTAKGLLLKDIIWEIKRKVFDNKLGQLDNFEYATLSIMYSQPGIEEHGAKLIGEGFSLQLPTVTEPKQITLELQKKDVTKLIDILQKILDTF
jgi:hypothetical protein